MSATEMTDETTDDEKGATLQKSALSIAIRKIAEGEVISIDDLKALVAPKPEPLEAAAAIPLPAVITSAQREALRRLPEVFGSVVPTERRKLEPSEVALLVDEHSTLKVVEKMASGRIADIRLSVLNHVDADIIESKSEGEYGDDKRDKDGHFVRKGRIHATPGSDEFSVEPRKGAVTISPTKLAEILDHSDWLAVTRPERVVDENKLMLHLRKNPHLVEAIAAATETGRPSNTLYVRKPESTK